MNILFWCGCLQKKNNIHLDVLGYRFGGWVLVDDALKLGKEKRRGKRAAQAGAQTTR